MLKSGVRSIMSLFSRRKKLVVSGCSYTDNYARQEKIKEFPLWGELLAEKLDMDLINLGRCGYGNKAIYTSLAETILPRKDIGLCVAIWSEVIGMINFITPLQKIQKSLV